MAEHKRPGGLTALAVLNFVFGGLGALGLLALFALLGAASEIASASGAEMVAPPGSGLVMVSLIISVVSVVLLIVSGIGYLGLKKTLGWKMGNLYGVVSIISTIFSLVALSTGFGVGTAIGLIYPILTLALLNTTFKDDFVN